MRNLLRGSGGALRGDGRGAGIVGVEVAVVPRGGVDAAACLVVQVDALQRQHPEVEGRGTGLACPDEAAAVVDAVVPVPAAAVVV